MTRIFLSIASIYWFLSTENSILAEDFIFKTKSGMKPWVDVHTPKEMYIKQSSRGENWELIMSDEFNIPGRQFGPGKDHLWTALELPDGVNSGLAYYSINMTSTTIDEEDRGVFQIEIRQEENITFSVFNAYSKPPSLETHSMYYRSGMVQSWNKFCFQGGLMEVVAKLPGAVSKKSGNPDLKDENARVENIEYYPTWPGIWLLGNLGRALFTGSTNRMWPWSYNVCDKELEKDQRISACDNNPGFGLNPNQGRGAPEIDLLEGGGTDISTSIQLAPGMPEKFRLFPPLNDSNIYCMYAKQCETIGANYPGIPTKVYAERGYKSWYQGLRYTPNSLCFPNSTQIQDTKVVMNSMRRGIKSNKCEGVNTCPASGDGYSDLGLMDDGTNGTRHWGINDIGGCMPVINGYMGSYLCDPNNTDKKCSFSLRESKDRNNVMAPFNYQMDAISANSGLPLAAYTSYLSYQLEWVPGPEGYVRWMMEDLPLYEIPADALENPPQDEEKANPRKLMIEEPMYVIFNVALSTSWGTKPPNPGQPCQGNGTDERVNRICDSFPMFLKIDYIRIFQDTSSTSKMQIGCDPNSHPTKKWIQGHIEEYENPANKVIEIIGGATCTKDDDCTVDTVAGAHIITGTCKQRHCDCHVAAWGGPRCTTALTIGGKSIRGFGPPMDLAFSIGVAIVCTTFGVILFTWYKHRREQTALRGPELKKMNNYNEESGYSYEIDSNSRNECRVRTV